MNDLFAAKRPLLILGEQSETWEGLPKELLTYAEPLANAQSNLNLLDLVLASGKINPTLSPDLILQCGGRLVSKRVLKSIKAWVEAGARYYLINPDPLRYDPEGILKKHIRLTPKDFFSSKTFTNIDQVWKDHLLKLQKRASTFLNEITLNHSQAHLIRSILSKKWETVFFIGNSTPIRDVTLLGGFKFPQNVFANRGVSGIEGHIATAIGIGESSRKPCIAIMGDLCFLHDINSLALDQIVEYPHVILVIHNGGGTIFRQLPHLKANVALEKYFVASHQHRLSDIAKSFGVISSSSNDSEKVIERVSLHLQGNSKRILVIEFLTDGEKDIAEVNKIVSQISDSI